MYHLKYGPRGSVNGFYRCGTNGLLSCPRPAPCWRLRRVALTLSAGAPTPSGPVRTPERPRSAQHPPRGPLATPAQTPDCVPWPASSSAVPSRLWLCRRALPCPRASVHPAPLAGLPCLRALARATSAARSWSLGPLPRARLPVTRSRLRDASPYHTASGPPSGRPLSHSAFFLCALSYQKCILICFRMCCLPHPRGWFFEESE